MFARVKKAGPYQYLQIVENRWENKRSIQRVIATVGRMDQMQAKGQVETLIRSLSRLFRESAPRAVRTECNRVLCAGRYPRDD